ncbi:endolytic transglycosylase MltG [Marinimicrobium sp. ABcell2]|uniref:endolytic transglycosylase MltG n=1 Tax=Marinimicrobium sp. ABcell2 TaxID=3069751 RepID=UPI0027B273F2|nr:endolytic transglycosylase MltG [Marinimicrobium sp. ABcell2]MDQ2075679.1 endolytic transglycosylase MltG [Marinimicrobium sp. ABcell2]
MSSNPKKRKGLNFWVRVFMVLVVVGLLGAGVGVGYSYHWLHSPMEVPAEGRVYELPTGQSLSHLSARLNRDGVLEYPRLLRLYARLTEATRAQAGEYFLQPGTTPVELLGMLNRGDTVLHQVTLVEGWTFQQALTALHARDTITPTLKGLTAEEQLQRLDLDIEHPEGWFFPDSYRYTRGTSDVEILRKAHRRMESLLAELWERRAVGLPYESPYEALIMASIVERETGAPWERDEIAGVFVRRLDKGMRLQTDPTVIYGMGSNYQGRITRRDLRTPTPYNTYTNHGLPPTPIALPGKGALEASLNPLDGETLFFVARGDGTHVFSRTLEEHNRAVRQYQLQRRENYRSTPPAQPPEQLLRD